MLNFQSIISRARFISWNKQTCSVDVVWEYSTPVQLICPRFSFKWLKMLDVVFCLDPTPNIPEKSFRKALDQTLKVYL